MWTIYLKELLELARDRKAVIFTIVIPIFALPLIFAGLGYLSSHMFKSASQAELPYALFGQQYAPALAARFAAEKGYRLVQLPDIAAVREAIATDRIKFALVIPPDIAQRLQAHQPATLALHYNSAVSVDMTRRRVLAVIDAHNGVLREQALSSMNLNRGQLRFALEPLVLEDHSTADKRAQAGAIVGGMLPYMLLMVCLMAAMYPAIDTGAGEKERGTLETLLLAPLPRSAIVLAKFLMLFTVGLTSALLMVASLSLLLFFFRGEFRGDLALMLSAIGAGDLAMVALMLVPAAAMFAAVLLSISVYAKSYKEASGMIQPLILVMIVPVLLAMLPGVELTWQWALVPMTNIALAMKELVKGTMDYRLFGVILVSSSVSAGALLALCRWWFNREQVLFRN